MVAAQHDRPVSPLDASAKRLLGDRRLILAANRGPVSFSSLADGSLRPRRGSGGVVTALSQVSSHVPLTWVASAMSDADRRAARSPAALDRAMPHEAVRLRFATVPRSVFEGAYNVIANPLLWFLQHELWNLPERPMVGATTMRAWREGYVELNRAFATAVLAEVPRRDRSPRIMLHDYHLYLAAEPIRRARPDAILSHFTHIPWPSSSIWQVMPPVIREDICAGLLANDVVGFQTRRYAHNFLRSVESFLPDAQVDYRARSVLRRGRTTLVRSYPISIDVAATKARNMVYFNSSARSAADLNGVPMGTATTNRTISFGSQPLFPPGIDDSTISPGPFFNLYLNDTANPCSQGLGSGLSSGNNSGIVFFPGSAGLYKNGVLVGGLGVSGDGVDQDDFVTSAGTKGFEAPDAIRADQILIEDVRLPYFKFPRNPTN